MSRSRIVVAIAGLGVLCGCDTAVLTNVTVDRDTQIRAPITVSATFSGVAADTLIPGSDATQTLTEAFSRRTGNIPTVTREQGNVMFSTPVAGDDIGELSGLTGVRGVTVTREGNIVQVNADLGPAPDTLEALDAAAAQAQDVDATRATLVDNTVVGLSVTSSSAVTAADVTNPSWTATIAGNQVQVTGKATATTAKAVITTNVAGAGERGDGVGVSWDSAVPIILGGSVIGWWTWRRKAAQSKKHPPLEGTSPS
jgi:hypothetical protein